MGPQLVGLVGSLWKRKRGPDLRLPRARWREAREKRRTQDGKVHAKVLKMDCVKPKTIQNVDVDNDVIEVFSASASDVVPY